MYQVNQWCTHVAAVFFQMAKFCERDPVHAGIYRIFKMNGIVY